jgi:hypothetical protein
MSIRKEHLMPSKLDPSSLSLVALCCGTIASGIIAFDPLPHGHPVRQAASLLISPAGASEAATPAPEPLNAAADRDFDMP